ncbi:ComF family protein [Rheinheimera maricola]|uniref:ComF family protein n=1 Tax=Rheinheimera maricola TaxID=2793282 RepID=A0ABS7XGB2_9GAMM|nr:ComF family protein [Rheinheimera maricola]MBZ9613693.1 ComF family protein [Rheinheimera maricola]
MLNTYIQQFGRLWHYLLPSPCLWCSLPVQQFDRQLCHSCHQALPQLPYQLCHYNLLWLPQVSRGLKKPGFDQLLSVGYYRHPYRHWLQRWKFNQDYGAGELLQQQFCNVLCQYKQHTTVLPEAIIYVPMQPAKQRQRGFNPAQLLAYEGAKQLQLPVLSLLQRSGKQQAQVGLNRKQRQRNLRHVFALPAGITVPARIALVDDVVTTGATANTLCRLLRRAGARHISLWTVAVTLYD